VRSARPEIASVPTLVLPLDGLGASEWILPALPLKFAKEHGDYDGCRPSGRTSSRRLLVYREIDPPAN